jgi:chorismate dehydratase
MEPIQRSTPRQPAVAGWPACILRPVQVRLGGVSYGVGAPLLHGLDARPGVELVVAPPRALIPLLRERRLDAALVSSVEAFRRPGYRAVSGLAITCEGPARSVRAFRARERRLRTAGVDAGSESSVALLRILLHDHLGAPDCTFARIAPTLAPDALPHDLVLLIGDCGLRADPGRREILDLGELWHAWIGLPFVFALWLLAPGASAERIVPLLHEARAAAQRAGVDDGTRGAIGYELGQRELAGLERFRARAAALGLVEPDIALDVCGSEPARRDDFRELSLEP